MKLKIMNYKGGIMKKKKIKNKRIVIECTENQALLIEQSLEAVSRFCMGQIDMFVSQVEVIRKKWFKNDRIEKLIKPILFPELEFNESYGVGHTQLGSAQILYEIVKVLQNYRAKDFKHPGVLASPPLHYSKEPLIIVKEEEK